MNDFAAETRVGREGGRVEAEQCRGHRNGAGEVVAGNVEGFERRLVEGRDGSVEAVATEAEVVEAVEVGEPGGDGSGEIVVGEIQGSEAVEGEE